MQHFKNWQNLQGMEWRPCSSLALLSNYTNAAARIESIKNEVQKREVNTGKIGDLEPVYFLEIMGGLGFDVFADTIARKIAQIPQGYKIHVLLNSVGGSFFEGLSIANLLFMVRDRVTVHLLGIAASAASLIAFCGGRLLVYPHAKIFIHEAHTFTSGGVAAHKKALEALEMLNGDLLSFYGGHFAKADKNKIRKMMHDETMLNADDLKALGVVFESVEMPAAALSISSGQTPPQTLQNVAEQYAAAQNAAKLSAENHAAPPILSDVVEGETPAAAPLVLGSLAAQSAKLAEIF